MLATHNQNKLKEFNKIFVNTNIEILSLKSFTKNEPIENGKSFEDNALIKARYASKLTSFSYPTIADDSGLCIDNLNGAPGIFSARWAYKNDYNCAFDKIKNHLNKKGLNMNEQLAKFVCVLALIDKKKNEFIFKGILQGKIVFPPRGKNGFGYDPIFAPLNFNKTLAQASSSLKNSLSHRKKALVKLLKHDLFKDYFSQDNFINQKTDR